MGDYDLPLRFRDVVASLANENVLVCAEHTLAGESGVFADVGTGILCIQLLFFSFSS